MKKQLGLPLDKKIILYAPTFRERGKVSLPFNPIKLIESLHNPDEFIFIVKLHYLSWLDQSIHNYKIVDYTNYSEIFDSLLNNYNMIDYTNYSEISDLMLISDMLISDYSSLILDYSILNKPIVLFQYDKEEYFKNRGVYFDFKDFIPSKQIVQKKEELYKLMSSELENDNSKMKEFFYPYENGNSTKKIVKALDFDDSPRRSKEIIFLVNELNQVGGVHSFILNMAKYYKIKYNSKIFVMAIKEFHHDENLVKIFESEYIDFTLCTQTNTYACKTILSNTNGYVISLQFSAHLHFQNFLKDKNSILMFHGDVKDIISKNIYQWHLDSLNSYKFYNYKKLIVLSEKQEDLLKHHLNMDIQKKLTSITNSIELDYTPLKQSPETNFAYIGRLSKDKNVMALIDIGKEIKKQNLDFKINIYGTGNLLNKIKNEIKNNELENILFLRGYEEDKEKIFKNNRALILVSKTEGFPLVILEAYSYNKPVILFNSFTSASDIVNDYKTGFLVNPYDYSEFIEKMKKVNEIKEENIKKQLEKFNNEKIFKKWNSLLSQIENEIEVKPRNNKHPSKSKAETVQKSNLKLKNKGKNRGKTKITKRKAINYLSKHLPRSTKKLKSIVYKLQGKKPFISVIIPCYNSTETVKDAIKSVLRQKRKNIEIIVIDDGSEDRVEDIVKRFNSFKIKYYFKEHSGLGMTRNYGIEKAIGKYLFFLDSDDEITKNSLNALVKFAEHKKLDVVSGLTKRYHKKTQNEDLWFPSLYNKKHIDDIKTRLNLYNDTLSTNKIYRKDYLIDNNILFKNNLYEDKIFTTEIYTKTEKIGILNQIVYIWNVREDNSSITTSINPENFKERIKSINTCWDYLPEYRKPYTFSFFMNHDMRIYINKFKFFTEEEKKEIFEIIKEFCNKYGEYLYPMFTGSKIRLKLIQCVIDDNYEDFLKIANIKSNNINS
nr:CDP-glycerol glycerophosphotransferase family protein [Methanobrevibacter filiformis]